MCEKKYLVAVTVGHDDDGGCGDDDDGNANADEVLSSKPAIARRSEDPICHHAYGRSLMALEKGL